MTAQLRNVPMNRTAVCAGFGFLFLVGLGVARVQAQQPVAAEPQVASRTVQTPPEVVPSLPVPRLVKFAGTLTDEQGKPRTGVVGVTFAVYKEQEGGGPLWLETQNVQLDEQGHYTVLLGASKSEGLPLELFTAGEPRWLGVQVNLPREVEQPRVLLVSVPYALKAADADTLGGKPLSSFVLTSPSSQGGAVVSALPNPATGAAAIGGGGSPNVVAKFDATGLNVINSSISDNGSRITAGEGIDFSSDFSFVGNADPVRTGRVQMFDRANVGFVIRGLNVLVETLQGSSSTPTEVMRWTQSGNVGIHTTNPNATLDVAGGVHIEAGNSSLRVEGPAHGTLNGVLASWGGSGDFAIDAFNVTAGRFVVKDSGNVGIGTATPANTLEVKAGGTTLADAWTTRSSARLKTNIQPIIGALDKIERLHGVSYDWKANGKHDLGLIAEEVARVVPEVVAFEPNGKDAQGLDYARLTALLIEAVKQQQAQINLQKAQLRTLQLRLRKIERRPK